jgi:hypothetical protein
MHNKDDGIKYQEIELGHHLKGMVWNTEHVNEVLWSRIVLFQRKVLSEFFPEET